MAQVQQPPPQSPPRSGVSALFQVMVANALILSGLYLVTGLVVEVLLRIYPAHWVLTASLVVDSLPARVLDTLGVLPRITEAYAYDRLSGFWLRALFGLTTVVIIFGLAVAVGTVTSFAGWLWMRRGSRRQA